MISVVEILDMFFTVVLIALSIFGTVKLFKKKEPLYFKMVVCAGWCLVAQLVYQYCIALCVEYEFATEQSLLTGLGDNAFAAFLFAANFGPMNNLLDNKDKKSKTISLISVIAPVFFIVWGVLLCYLCYQLGGDLLSYVVLLVLTTAFMPSCVYFNLKYLLIPDDGFFVKGIRPVNLCSLLFCFSVFLEMTGPLVGSELLMDVGFDCELFFGAVSVLAAVWGRKKWHS